MNKLETALRRRAEESLKQTIPDATWAYLRRKWYVEEAIREELSLDNFCQEARYLFALCATVDKTATPPAAERTRRQRRTKTMTLQTDALSKCVADRARADPEVIAFRNQYLQAQVLPYQAASAWIESQVPSRYDPQQHSTAQSLDPVTSSTKDTSLDLLHYGKQGSVHKLPFERVGALHELFCLSQKLSVNFGWQEAQATMFIMTDLPPRISRLQWRLVGVADKADRTSPPFGCLARLMLNIDPTMPPRELADGYAKIRSKLLSERSRSQTEKHIHLAMFALEHPDCDKKARLEWNKRHPRWEYSRWSRFKKEANTARRRLEAIVEKGSLDFGKSLSMLWS